MKDDDEDDEVLVNYLPGNLLEATMETPLAWLPSIIPLDGISAQAIREQSDAVGYCIRAIDRFLNPFCCGLKFPCLVGRPGSGKSHVLKIACAYALGKGLQVELMSFTSERARKMKGNHLHIVFPLSVKPGKDPMTYEIIYDCIKNLENDLLKAAVIKRTDIFYWKKSACFRQRS